LQANVNAEKNAKQQPQADVDKLKTQEKALIAQQAAQAQNYKQREAELRQTLKN